MRPTNPLVPREQQWLTVLIVDPDGDGAGRLAAALGDRHRVAVVPTAHAALRAIEAGAPDLLVTELDLPDGNGLELLGRIHSAAATRHTLLMVVSRRASTRDRVAAFAAGADDYLVKPVETAEFVTHVASVLRFRQVIRW
jgi:DNA-binding response OmpR family regulator